MKTKYFFYSLALAGAFTACSQEELVEAPVMNDNVASRPVAGLVEFSTEGVESRFNHETASWQNGDVFGLYLMDQYVGNYNGEGADWPGEHPNANEYLTKKLDGVVDEVNGYSLWAYQDHWKAMYELTNSIQSNYPFTYGNGVWTNDAKLVEGNYFAMYPQNEKALNRRELWYQIDPSITLKKHSKFNTTRKNTFVNLDNQFFLGYSQIYRNETSSAEGRLKMNLDLKGAMVPVKFMLQGFSNNDVKLDKIEFKAVGNGQLPTLALIEPAFENSDWRKVTPKSSAPYMNWYEKDCGEWHGLGLYDESLTWTRQTIQDLVEWTETGDRIPYGCEAKKAYTYSIAFPGEFDEKVELAGNENETVYAYFALPAFANDGENSWDNLYAVVYGWQLKYEGTPDERWEYGILTNMALNGQKSTDISITNKSFGLTNEMLNAWAAAENDYFLTIQASYDNYGWVTVNQALVAETEEMNDLIKARVMQASSGQEVNVTIMPDADGVEIQQSLIDWLIVEAKKYKNINITFDGSRDGKVIFNQNNTLGIDTDAAGEQYAVKFNYTNKITLVNNAEEQIVPYYYSLTDESVVIENNTKLTVNGVVTTVVNNGEMTVAFTNTNVPSVTKNIENWGKLTLGAYANVTKIENKPAAEIDVVAPWNKVAVVNELFNQKDNNVCNGCQHPVLNVNGYLNVSNLDNTTGTVNVATNGVLTATGNPITIKAHIDSNVHYSVINNNGKITGKGIGNKGALINNNGTIEGTLSNSGTINANGGKITDLYQYDGTVNVTDETVEIRMNAGSVGGNVVFKGVVAGHVDNHSKVTKIFEVTANDETWKTVVDKMQRTGSTTLLTAKDITFVALKNNAGELDQSLVDYRLKITDIVIPANSNVTFKGQERGKKYTIPNATITVKEPNGQLNISNATTIEVKAKSGNIHIETGSALNGAQVDHNGEEDAVVNADADNQGSSIPNAVI